MALRWLLSLRRQKLASAEALLAVRRHTAPPPPGELMPTRAPATASLSLTPVRRLLRSHFVQMLRAAFSILITPIFSQTATEMKDRGRYLFVFASRADATPRRIDFQRRCRFHASPITGHVSFSRRGYAFQKVESFRRRCIDAPKPKPH